MCGNHAETTHTAQRWSVENLSPLVPKRFGVSVAGPSESSWSVSTLNRQDNACSLVKGSQTGPSVAGAASSPSSSPSLSLQHKPWILAVYGMWACRCVLGTRGTAVVLVHTAIAFCVAQFRSQSLSWLCSLSLLSALRLPDVEEVKVSLSFFFYQWEGDDPSGNAVIQADAFVFRGVSPGTGVGLPLVAAEGVASCSPFYLTLF